MAYLFPLFISLTAFIIANTCKIAAYGIMRSKKHAKKTGKKLKLGATMPKKEWTDEERKAFGDKMRAARAQKETETPTVVETPQNVTLTQDQFDEIMARLKAAENQASQPAPQAPQAAPKTGIIEKFPINPKFYPSPVEELYELPELRRFAMRQNFEIRYKVYTTKYQVASGEWYMEPRFEITLLRRRFDDDGNELKNKIIIGRASFFEDPPANILEADLAGLAVDEVETIEGAAAMRFYRYKTWIIGKLQPRKVTSSDPAERLEVINGQVYQIETSEKVL